MTLRLALVIPTMDRGGAEKQLALLATNLPKDEFEVRVFLLTRDGPRSDELRQAGIPVTLIGKPFKGDPRALLKLKQALRTFSPHIAHTWLFAANSFGRAASLLAGVPVVIASERCVDPWKSSWQFAIDRWLARRSQAITTNSEGVKDFYVRHGIAPELFRVIPNGIPPTTAKSITREEACERIGADPSRKLIFAIGRLWPQKRYKDLIWAAELLAAMRDDTTLVIIGDGPQKEELMRFRDDVTTPRHVCFVGARQDVPELLPHADLFWIGSEYEGQSNSLIEAMQAGVPVIASDIPGNRDLVLPDETGRLVGLGDRADFARQSNDLLEHPGAAEELRRRAADRIELQFSVAAMVQGHVDLYRELAAGEG